MEGAVEDGDVGEIRQRSPRLLDPRERRGVVQRRELDRRGELALDVVVDQNRITKARPAVDDAVRNGRNARRNGVE